MNKFKGLGVALVTPFNADGNVDFAALQRLVEHQINGGTDYLVVHGTTGESVTLTQEEKVATLEFIQEINKSRLPIVLGVGGNDTYAIAKKMETTNLNGVDGILSVSPAYNKPSQEGIYQHYKTVLGATDLPVILYNVPGRTSSNMQAETTIRIAEDFANAVAVKEASGDLEQIMMLIRKSPSDFLVISGDDALTLPMLACGGDGLISVVANAFPSATAAMVHDALEDNVAAARINHYKLFEIIQWLFADGNPGGVKEVLKFLNITHNHVRLPLVPVNKNVSDKLYQLVADSGLVKI